MREQQSSKLDSPAQEELLLPLTPAQRSIWLGQSLQPDDPLYNMVLTFRIGSQLDPEIFRAAFSALIQSCDALRTVVVSDDGEPRQQVLTQLPYELEVVDFSGEADPETAYNAWLGKRKLRRFDLGEGSFDSVLVKLSPRLFVWYFNQHHLFCDLWSISLLYKKCKELYSMARAGKPPTATPLPSFHRHAARELAATERSGADASSRLGAAASADLGGSSFYRPEPKGMTGETTRVVFALGKERSRRLRKLADSEQYRSLTPELSLFRIFATVLFAYLYRLSGSGRLRIGTPVHGRSTARRRATPGLFIELLPLQVECNEGETFRSLHEQVCDHFQALLLNALPGSGNEAKDRGFDVVLNYLTATFGDFDEGPTEVVWIHPDHGDRAHKLRLQVIDFDQQGAISLFFDLNAACFVDEERQWAGEHYLKLLDAFLANAEEEIAAVDIVSEQERDLLVRTFNAACDHAPPEETVVRLFERQAHLTPDRPAVICGAEQCSYKELASEVGRVADALAARGVGRGQRVAICMGRSIDAVVAMLGIMKAGAAYLPIDAEAPESRLSNLLRAADVRWLIAGAQASRQIPDDLVAVETLKSLVGGTGGGAATGAAGEADLDDVAYILFTSGSTGGPKGVVVGHRGLANYLTWAKHYYLRGEALDFPLFTALTFDLTVTSLFVPLISGGRLVIYPDHAESRRIPLLDVLADNQVDVVKVTPSHLALIKDMDLSASRVRKLIVGGENFPVELCGSVLQSFGGQVEIFNEYGPTEATVACMIHRYAPERDRSVSVPIGRSIGHLDVYLLNGRDRLVPRGAVGELCIGGLGVAKGYLGRPEETAARFVSNPFRPGEPVYRTGDLARYDPDGCMTYLGRADQQLKLNGVRIEPGEIEAAIMERKEITACVVSLSARPQRRARTETNVFCRRCGLPAAHPEAKLDGELVCSICRDFEQKQDLARSYFGSMADLHAIAAEIKSKATGRPNCMMLLSGGKDSSYALCKLVELGLTPLVFTLDNGYISEGAKANIRRIAEQLGLEVVVGRTDAMNAIFVDSLKRFSNVCNGCFKTIYTMSTQLARERGLTTIFTGLSRGQIFDTRLADLFKQGIVDPIDVDRTILEARKEYHRMKDAVACALDVSVFDDDAIFEEIRFVDFYRYCDATLEDILAYLGSHVPWIRPSDSGRSTNCLINDLGIHVHKAERGYHNYAAPYSWDVRLGHKQRDAALDELDDAIDVSKVNRILSEIGYQPAPSHGADDVLVAYYVAPDGIPAASLRAELEAKLPKEYMPRHYVRLDALPLTPNGKIDRKALPAPYETSGDQQREHVEPSSDIERELARIWCEVLGLDRVGVDDNFFDLGGDSILNIRIVARARKRGISLTAQQVFDFPTISDLAGQLVHTPIRRASQDAVTGRVPMTPAQHRHFESNSAPDSAFTQSVVLCAESPLDPELVSQALTVLRRHHDALRATFRQDPEGTWQQIIGPADEVRVSVERIDWSDQPSEKLTSSLNLLEKQLASSMSLESGDLIRAASVARGPENPELLMIAIHHLVVDGVSWWILLEDLETVYAQLAAGQPPKLAEKTSSLRDWAEALVEGFQDAAAERRYWSRSLRSDAGMLKGCQAGGPGLLGDSTMSSVALDREETAKLIHETAGRLSAQMPELLISALFRTLADWSARDSVRVEIEGHGREELFEGIDLSRTVGWFTTNFPVTLRETDRGEAWTVLSSIKRQLAAVPKRGLGYGVLRYMQLDGHDRSALVAAHPPEILFNYLGRWDGVVEKGRLLRLMEPLRVYRDPDRPREHAIEVVAVVFEGRLRIDWVYAGTLFESATVDGLARQFLGHLRALLADDRGASERDLSAADFPLSDLDQQALDDLLTDLGEPG